MRYLRDILNALRAGCLQTGRFSLYGSSVRGTWRGLLVGDPEGYERRALGTGSSLYGGSAGATCGWAHLLGLKDMAEGALEMVCLSPWELCEGNLVVAPSRGP